jgi:hypothetical protein
MARDNFTMPTKEALAKRVAYRCSNPRCRAVTIGPHQQSSRAVNIAAHIAAASPGGPRYACSKILTAVLPRQWTNYGNRPEAALLHQPSGYWRTLLVMWRHSASVRRPVSITGARARATAWSPTARKPRQPADLAARYGDHLPPVTLDVADNEQVLKRSRPRKRIRQQRALWRHGCHRRREPG